MRWLLRGGVVVVVVVFGAWWCPGHETSDSMKPHGKRGMGNWEEVRGEPSPGALVFWRQLIRS